MCCSVKVKLVKVAERNGSFYRMGKIISRFLYHVSNDKCHYFELYFDFCIMFRMTSIDYLKLYFHYCIMFRMSNIDYRNLYFYFYIMFEMTNMDYFTCFSKMLICWLVRNCSVFLSVHRSLEPFFSFLFYIFIFSIAYFIKLKKKCAIFK